MSDIVVLGSLNMDLVVKAKRAFANGAGTLAVTRLGAQTSLPTREEVEAFIVSDLL